MSEANGCSSQTQFVGLVLTEGSMPECPPGVEYCNESYGQRWNNAEYMIGRLLVPHVIVLGNLRSPRLLELLDKAEHHGLDITILSQSAEVATALR